LSLGRLLLVEDDKRLADLLKAYLEQAGFVVDCEGDGLRASMRIPNEQPDAVILDVGLPGIDGLEVCKRVRQEYGGVILMLTARGDELDQVLGLELGADAYVTKPTSPRVLVARLKALLRRSRGDWEEEENVSSGPLSLERKSRSARLHGSDMHLSSGEFDLLWLLASRPGRVLERESLLDALDHDLDTSGRAIDMMISRLRQHLGDKPGKPTWIRTVRGIGYLFMSPE
jgi:two-component system response regulator RstA